MRARTYCLASWLSLSLGAWLAAPVCATEQPQRAEASDPDAGDQSVSQAYRAVECEGTYAKHLQGICTNDRDAIYWCFTDVLVKTDLAGRVLCRVAVADHHGDLCHHDGKVYVAVNLGKFNQPAGQADSWVYVYDADTLAEVARHRTPELVHGAGGIACDGERFVVVGGLPEGVYENFAYEYDASFTFQRRHVLESGYTFLGIQTATFAAEHWWFGCYGNPQMLLKVDRSFQLVDKWKFDGSLGLVGLADGRFLIGRGGKAGDNALTGRILPAVVDGAGRLQLQADGPDAR